MMLTPEELDSIHVLEGTIRDPRRSIEERKRAIAAIADLGEGAKRLLIAISIGQWLQPLPRALMVEAARCARQLDEPDRRRRERRRKGSTPNV